MERMNVASRRWMCVVSALVLLVGAGYGDGKAEAAKTPGGKKGAPPPAKVRVDTAKEGTLHVTRSFFGEVRPTLEASLAAGASGEIERIEVREGDRVTRGQILVRIDTSLVDAQIKQAEAQIEQIAEQRAQAEREAERVENLGAEVAPQIEAERERSRARAFAAQLASQQATLKRARAERTRHLVRAPFDAVVAERALEPGDWVGPGTSVLRLVDDTRVEIFVATPPELADQLEQGAPVLVRLRDHSAKGSIVGVVRALDARTRTLTLRVATDEAARWLLPGDTVRVEIDIVRTSEGVTVSRDAIIMGAAGRRLLLVDAENKAKSVEVEVLATSDSDALLAPAKGLEQGARVIVRGNERLRPGQAVSVQPGEEARP